MTTNQVRKKYAFKLRFFKVVPLGNHTIELIQIDRANKKIVSKEHGSLTSVWNHSISFNNVAQNKLQYQDRIEIKAGFLTLFVWAFSVPRQSFTARPDGHSVCDADSGGGGRFQCFARPARLA